MVVERQLQVALCCYATTYDSCSVITADVCIPKIRHEGLNTQGSGRCGDLIRLLDWFGERSNKLMEAEGFLLVVVVLSNKTRQKTGSTQCDQK